MYMKGVVFFVVLFVGIFLIYYFFEKINDVLRIDRIVKCLVIAIGIIGIISPALLSNLDTVTSKDGLYNFFAKNYSVKKK